MELTQIKYFLELAETQHVTKSAKTLHIAQPALTQAIKRFESELGVPLFVRHGRNIILTEYGQYLKKRLSPIIDELSTIPEDLKRMAKIESSTVRLSIHSASAHVTEAIIEYKKTHKNINFQMRQNPAVDLYDIEVSTRPHHSSLNVSADNSFACTEKIYLAVPSDGKYADIESIALKDVQNESFISLAGSLHMRQICDTFCHQAGFKPHIIFESDNLSSVKNMIAANIGIGFWPKFTWGKIDTDKIKLLKITDPVCQRDLIIKLCCNKNDSRAVMDFFTFLKAFTVEKSKS